jgi:hypothetical protein
MTSARRSRSALDRSVTLDRLADQPVDLLVNGKSVARGESS